MLNLSAFRRLSRPPRPLRAGLSGTDSHLIALDLGNNAAGAVDADVPDPCDPEAVAAAFGMEFAPFGS